MSNTKHDPDHYRLLAVPFPSVGAANEALSEFFAAVEAAREKFHIADVFVAAQISTMSPDGGPSRHGAASCYYGDIARNKLALVARAYGEAREEHEQLLGELIAAGREQVRSR